MGDWRLTGQERYLKGATLRRRRWTLQTPEWDHDHCEFCWAKFPDELPEGYATEDSYRWICEQCFTDFREMFEWKLVS